MTIIQNGVSPAAPGEEKGQPQTANPFLRLIQYHYSGAGYERSCFQIKKEETLLPCVPFSRWFTLPAAILIQFCCGSLYSWSIYNKPIDILIYGENRNIAPITFYIAVGCFGSSAAIMGPWLERRGPRTACLVGASLLFIGNLITALALYLKLMWLVFIGYGIVGGFGFGLSYISPISAIQKWFPDRRGLASGFATCGFGAGSILISKLQIPLIESVGLPITFAVLGSSFFITMTLSAMVLRLPPPNFVVNGMTSDQIQIKPEIKMSNGNHNHVIEIAPPKPKMTLIEAITSKEFGLMYIMFSSNVIFGLVVVSRFSNIITDIFEKTPDEAATAVSINGACNLIGRLIISVISDYVGRKNCFTFMLTSQLIIIGSFSTIATTQTYWAFLLTMWILGACYGAGFGVIPAYLTDIFGPSNIGACHGIILTAWAIAGVGGGVIFTTVFSSLQNSGNYSQKDPFPYIVNIWWIFGVVLIGWGILFFVKPTGRDKIVLKKLKDFFLCRRKGNVNVDNNELH